MSATPATRIERRGLLLVLSSPSGAGKTTLAKRLLESDPGFESSVSVTTRARRASEVDGRDYHFIDEARFAAMRDRGELLEWAQVFERHYGTPKAPVMAAMTAGRDVLFDIDWQGARQLGEKVPSDLVRVFILPPTAKALEDRLKARNQDAPEVVARRMAAAADEIGHWNEYDYVLVNDDLDVCYRRLIAIVEAERMKRARQPQLPGLVDRLLAELS